MIWHSVSLRAKNINFNYLQLKKFLNLTFSKLLSGRAKNMVKIPPPIFLLKEMLIVLYLKISFVQLGKKSYLCFFINPPRCHGND